MARLLAKSPCPASRVFSTSMLTSRALAGTSSSGKAARARSSNFSIKVFKRIRRGRGRKGGQFTRRGVKLRQSVNLPVSSQSVYFQRVHVDGPTQARRPGQPLHLRQPLFEKALQCGARGGLDQEMRSKMIGPPRNQGAGGAQHIDRRFAQRPAGV